MAQGPARQLLPSAQRKDLEVQDIYRLAAATGTLRAVDLLVSRCQP